MSIPLPNESGGSSNDIVPSHGGGTDEQNNTKTAEQETLGGVTNSKRVRFTLPTDTPLNPSAKGHEDE